MRSHTKGIGKVTPALIGKSSAASTRASILHADGIPGPQKNRKKEQPRTGQASETLGTCMPAGLLPSPNSLIPHILDIFKADDQPRTAHAPRDSLRRARALRRDSHVETN